MTSTRTISHPLEHDTAEFAYFQTMPDSSYRAAYRRAVERLTGSLPTWAYRKPAGRPRRVRPESPQ